MSGNVTIFGNPVLRTKAVPVGAVTDELRELAEHMLKIMYAAQGVGLAAEQIGRTESIFVIDIPADGIKDNPGVQMPLIAINPEIIGMSDETAVAEEGCLSFPKLYVPVRRPADVVLRYTDQNGQSQVVSAKGLLARAIQHENDHLNGVLLVDHMTAAEKIQHMLLLRKLKRQSKGNA
ncbi:MAG: peptide deformylase [Kiritimatiellales bacterium]